MIGAGGVPAPSPAEVTAPGPGTGSVTTRRLLTAGQRVKVDRRTRNNVDRPPCNVKKVRSLYSLVPPPTKTKTVIRAM